MHFRTNTWNDFWKKLPDKKSFKSLAISFKNQSDKSCLAVSCKNLAIFFPRKVQQHLMSLYYGHPHLIAKSLKQAPENALHPHIKKNQLPYSSTQTFTLPFTFLLIANFHENIIHVWESRSHGERKLHNTMIAWKGMKQKEKKNFLLRKMWKEKIR